MTETNDKSSKENRERLQKNLKKTGITEETLIWIEEVLADFEPKSQRYRQALKDGWTEDEAANFLI